MTDIYNYRVEMKRRRYSDQQAVIISISNSFSESGKTMRKTMGFEMDVAGEYCDGWFEMPVTGYRFPQSNGTHDALSLP